MIGSATKWLLVAWAVIIEASSAVPSWAEPWKLPEVPPPHRYGTLLLDRASTRNNVKPVSFSHWVHRRNFTCRVCHGDLDFAMVRGTTPITEKDNREGRYCGKCHNGIKSFALAGNCDRCHNGDLDHSRAKYATLGNLPGSGFANLIDWVKAEESGQITPKSWTKPSMKNDRDFKLKARWSFVPPSKFSHRLHAGQMNCDSCHPDLFNVTRDGSNEITMEAILKGEFCGACHLSVAFPVNHCKRCHTEMTAW